MSCPRLAVNHSTRPGVIHTSEAVETTVDGGVELEQVTPPGGVTHVVDPTALVRLGLEPLLTAKMTPPATTAKPLEIATTRLFMVPPVSVAIRSLVAQDHLLPQNVWRLAAGCLSEFRRSTVFSTNH